MQIKNIDAAVVSDSRLGDRQIRVIANSGMPDREGDVLVARGCDLRNYSRNPVVLADHDPSRPIGNFAPEIRGDALAGVITFAPKGASEKADEYCALYKSGVLKGISVGFRSVAREPLTDGGWKYTAWELFELSCVAVPMDPGALVVARSLPLGRRERRQAAGVEGDDVQAALARVMALLDKSSMAHVQATSLLAKSDFHRSRAKCLAADVAAGDGDDVPVALARVTGELDKSAMAHAKAIGCLEKSDRHRSQAGHCASDIAVGAGGQSDDDYADPGDDDSDVELSFSAGRRGRLAEIRARAAALADPSRKARLRMIQVFARSR